MSLGAEASLKFRLKPSSWLQCPQIHKLKRPSRLFLFCGVSPVSACGARGYQRPQRCPADNWEAGPQGTACEQIVGRQSDL